MKKQVFRIVLLTLCFISSRAQTTSTKPDASAIYEKSSPAVVLVLCENKAGRFQGSGVILRGDGLIATNFHVCDRATAARIKLSNGKIYDEVSILDFDEGKDIIILKINGTNLPTFNISEF